MALPSSGNPISFADINDELGENTTDTLDILTAAQKFTGILDDDDIMNIIYHSIQSHETKHWLFSIRCILYILNNYGFVVCVLM